MIDEETIAVYDAQAAAYRARFTKEGNTHLAAFLEAVPAGSRLLDLGCGPGNAAAKMLEAGHEVLAIDASAGMVETAKAAGIAARLGTFDEVPTLGRFNGIWANFSLLHAPRADFARHVAAIAAALVPQGAFHIGMKTGTGEARDALGRRYSYFTEPEVSAHLRSAGFFELARHTGRSEGLDGTMADWVIVLARRDA